MEEPLIASLPVSSFSATSEHYSVYCQTKFATYLSWYSWCSEYSASELESVAGDEYLQIDLLSTAQIAAMGTKGSVVLNSNSWVTSYKIRYSVNDTWIWYNNGEILTGNEDATTEHQNKLVTPIIARYLRIYPMTAYLWVGLQIEAYGSYDFNASYSSSNHFPIRYVHIILI